MAARTLLAGAATGCVALGLVVGTPAAPALATAGITSPADGAIIHGGSSVPLSADTGPLRHGALRLRGPGDDGAYTVDKGTGHLSYRLDLSCPQYAGECSRTHPALNGTYTVTLASGLLFQHVQEERTFRLRVPPPPPTGVRATATGPRQVLLRWEPGLASDLASYDILSASGHPLARTLPASRACHDGGCAAVVRVPAENAGERVGFLVRSRRHTAPGSTATVASAPSSVAAVVLPTPPSASPSSGTSTEAARLTSPASSPSSSGFGGSHPLPGSAPRQKADAPRLRPMASASMLELPDVAKDGNDTFKPRLTYPAPTQSHRPTASPPSHHRTEGSGGRRPSAALRPADWWKSVALGLVLLLVAAHLGAWSWRVRPMSAGTRPDRATGGDAITPGYGDAVTPGRGEGSARAGGTGSGGYHGRRRR